MELVAWTFSSPKCAKNLALPGFPIKRASSLVRGARTALLGPPPTFSTRLAGEDVPASPAVLTAARRHGLRLAPRSGPRVCSQHPSHDCAQEKVAPQRLPEVAVRYRSGHQRVGHEQREAPYSE